MKEDKLLAALEEKAAADEAAAQARQGGLRAQRRAEAAEEQKEEILKRCDQTNRELEQEKETSNSLLHEIASSWKPAVLELQGRLVKLEEHALQQQKLAADAVARQKELNSILEAERLALGAAKEKAEAFKVQHFTQVEALRGEIQAAQTAALEAEETKTQLLAQSAAAQTALEKALEKLAAAPLAEEDTKAIKTLHANLLARCGQYETLVSKLEARVRELTGGDGPKKTFPTRNHVQLDAAEMDEELLRLEVAKLKRERDKALAEQRRSDLQRSEAEQQVLEFRQRLRASHADWALAEGRLLAVEKLQQAKPRGKTAVSPLAPVSSCNNDLEIPSRPAPAPSQPRSAIAKAARTPGSLSAAGPSPLPAARAEAEGAQRGCPRPATAPGSAAPAKAPADQTLRPAASNASGAALAPQRTSDGRTPGGRRPPPPTVHKSTQRCASTEAGRRAVASRQPETAARRNSVDRTLETGSRRAAASGPLAPAEAHAVPQAKPSPVGARARLPANEMSAGLGALAAVAGVRRSDSGASTVQGGGLPRSACAALHARGRTTAKSPPLTPPTGGRRAPAAVAGAASTASGRNTEPLRHLSNEAAAAAHPPFSSPSAASSRRRSGSGSSITSSRAPSAIPSTRGGPAAPPRTPGGASSLQTPGETTAAHAKRVASRLSSFHGGVHAGSGEAAGRAVQTPGVPAARAVAGAREGEHIPTAGTAPAPQDTQANEIDEGRVEYPECKQQ
eukprot:GHVT01008334.1.p1 GENE.GHVT01008334.1~~GHVT01008334.1.p1  ORF type:complete len:736 (-),score=219.40 GHVT01008334.1:327-2534(-)